MLTQYQTVENVVHDGLCMGCGVCQGICPQQAIQMDLDDKMGYFIPKIDYSVCDYCDKMKNGKCVVVCPGIEVDFDKLGHRWIGGNQPSDILGHSIRTLYAHAVDESIRYRSSSGGLITSLLIFMLEQKLIDGAVVIQSNKENPLIPQGVLAETPEDIVSASGSKYCSAHIGEPLAELLEREGNFAVVGLPCHIHGIRKWEQFNPELSSKIKYHFGLYCANNSTIYGTEYFLSQNHIQSDQVKSIMYRGNGWPGKLMIGLRNGEKKEIKRGTTEKSLIRKLKFSSSFHYDFQIPRCLTCIDLTAELADISFADPWNARFLRKETIGKSMLVIRNKIGDELIQHAEKHGVIKLEDTDRDEVRRSQNLTFKRKAPSRTWLRRMLGFSSPHYKGKSYPVIYLDVLSFGNYFMSWFTKYPFARAILPLIQIARWGVSVIIGKINKIKLKIT